MKNDFFAVITDKIKDSHSVFNKSNLYCCETMHDILKYILKVKYKIPEEKIFYGAENFNNYAMLGLTDINKPILYIMPECFDMPEKIFGQIISSGNAVFYANKKIFACFDTLDGSDNFSEYAPGYSPVQNFKELREKNIKAQEEIIAELENSGVQFVSLDGVCISPFAKIARGAIIYPGTIIRGESIIGENCTLGPNSIIENSQLGESCVINSAQIYSSVLENNVKIGPFAHIRPNCVIKSGAAIGNFVEIKNSNIGADTKAGHLTYIGDSDVGERVNFGCGSITANYDGVKKSRCDIKDGAFIGSNVNLIAPVTIGENAFVAAGSTFDKDVPADALAIARTREHTIRENWVEIRDRANKFGKNK